MATDFTQDALLHFLQSRGGSARNADLLLHFRDFIRDHADRNRNRELFKKFVNSVATVRQVDGVSYVFLRKKFKGHVPGSGDRGCAEPRPGPGPPPPGTAVPSRAGSAGKPPQRREATTPAPPGAATAKTILPAAGLVLNNNNNGSTNLNLKPGQVTSPPGPPGRAAAVSPVPVKTPRPPETPAPDQGPVAGQHRVGLGRPPGATPGATPVAGAVGRYADPRQQVPVPEAPLAGQHRVGLGRPPGATPVATPVVGACSGSRDPRQQVPVPEAPRGREARLQPEGALHQGPPRHHFIGLEPQNAPRRIRHRPSYKSAVSYDDEDEEEEEKEEEVEMRRESAGGAWSQSSPLGDLGRAFSASSPCIVEQKLPPSVVSSSSSSGRQIPKVFVQDAETTPPGGPGQSSQSAAGPGGRRPGPGLESGSVPAQSTRRSLPLEPRDDAHADRRYSHPAGVQPDPGHGPGAWLSSSHSSLSSSERPGSPKGPGWNSSCEDPQARAGVTGGGSQIQDAIQRAQRKKPELVAQHADANRSTGRLHGDQEATARWPPFHHSSDRLHDDPYSTTGETPWHLSTGDLHYDREEEAGSSDGSTSSPKLPLPRPAAARRLSSQLRSRMCRSLGADLDQLLQEDARAGGGSEAARLNRLHLISSSLSLRYDLSSSSLSSCSTPPRCHSLADLEEGAEGGPGRRSSAAGAGSSPTSPAAHHEASSRQSLVPLEPREHAWLVKGASAAWPDIYTLFREDASLLNRKDFMSGFTVLHWIAKHGDHRVLNTLWYGVQKAGLMFHMNARSTCGHTPLHIAAIHSNANIVRLLVTKFNADVKLRDTAGKKPWQYLSRAAPPDVFQLLGAPSHPAGSAQGGGGAAALSGPGQSPRQPPPRRRRRHHLSFASSAERPLTTTGTTRVKRSTSIAAFLKHKSLQRFQGHQSDSSL